MSTNRFSTDALLTSHNQIVVVDVSWVGDCDGCAVASRVCQSCAELTKKAERPATSRATLGQVCPLIVMWNPISSLR